MGDSKRSEMESGLVSRSGWAVIDDSWASPRSDGGRSYALSPNSDMGYPWWTQRADNHAMDTYVLGYTIITRKLLQTIPRLLVASLCHLIMCSVTGIVSMLLIRQMIIATL